MRPVGGVGAEKRNARTRAGWRRRSGLACFSRIPPLVTRGWGRGTVPFLSPNDRILSRCARGRVTATSAVWRGTTGAGTATTRPGLCGGGKLFVANGGLDEKRGTADRVLRTLRRGRSVGMKDCAIGRALVKQKPLVCWGWKSRAQRFVCDIP
jgi:hypothetical protein